jgi:hypothetical protein
LGRSSKNVWKIHFLLREVGDERKTGHPKKRYDQGKHHDRDNWDIVYSPQNKQLVEEEAEMMLERH